MKQVGFPRLPPLVQRERRRGMKINASKTRRGAEQSAAQTAACRCEATSWREEQRLFVERLGLLALCISAAACSAVYDGRYDYRAGWREGVVTEIGEAATLDARVVRDCSISGANARVAVVRYKVHASRAPSHGIFLRGADSLGVGDNVYVNPRTCSLAVPEATR